MARSSVIECVNDGGVVRAFTSFTTVSDSPRNDEEQEIINLEESSIVDGAIYCKVKREANTTVGGVNFNLIDFKHHLILASGTSFSANMVNIHDIDVDSSNNPLLLSRVTVVEGRSRTMLYLHASFMIVAWIGTTSVGIFTARFMKKTWTKQKVFGRDMWFVTHQICMILTWLLTLAAFIIILVDSTRWTTNPHSVLGTIAFTLCMIQPFGAFFRPGPKADTRPIFNFLHMTAGNLAHLMTSKFSAHKC
jgi:DOMON domain/Eukaryotic cytochrome b561